VKPSSSDLQRHGCRGSDAPVGAAVHLYKKTVNLRLVGGWYAVRCDGVRRLLPAAQTRPTLLGTEHRGECPGGALLVGAGPWCSGSTWTGGPARAGSPHQRLQVRPLPTVGSHDRGLIVGMTSVGSGSLMIVLLLFLYPLISANALVGTDLTQAVPLTAAAALGALIFGTVEFGVTAPSSSAQCRRADRLVLLLAGAGPLHQADHHLRDLCLRPEDIGVATTVLGWVLCAVLLTAGCYCCSAPSRGATQRPARGPLPRTDRPGGTAPGPSRAVTASTPTAKPPTASTPPPSRRPVRPLHQRLATETPNPVRDHDFGVAGNTKVMITLSGGEGRWPTGSRRPSVARRGSGPVRPRARPLSRQRCADHDNRAERTGDAVDAHGAEHHPGEGPVPVAADEPADRLPWRPRSGPARDARRRCSSLPRPLAARSPPRPFRRCGSIGARRYHHRRREARTAMTSGHRRQELVGGPASTARPSPVAALRWAARYAAATGARVRAMLAWHYRRLPARPPWVAPQPIRKRPRRACTRPHAAVGKAYAGKRPGREEHRLRASRAGS